MWVTTTRAIGPEKLINDALPRQVYAKDRNLSEFIQLQAKPPKNQISPDLGKRLPLFSEGYGCLWQSQVERYEKDDLS